MSASAPRPQDILAGRLSEMRIEDGGEASAAGLAHEVAALRQAVERLERLITERDAKGASLIDGYRTIIADIANLIEAQHADAVKREESVRFLLASIEARLVERLTGGTAPPRGRPEAKRGLFGRRDRS